jgi:hypothetical protein
MTSPAFFVPAGDAWRATEHTTGPWSPGFQHGGPPLALMARAAERTPTPDGDPWRAARVVADLLRPIPVGVVSTSVEALRTSRSVQTLAVRLHDGPTAAGRLLVEMKLTRLRQAPGAPFPDTRWAPLIPGPEAGEPLRKAFRRTPYPGYHRAMDVLISRGIFGEEPVGAWMRMRYPLVAGEETSGLCRTLTAGDATSGVAAVLDWDHFTFVNPELTLHLHRPPQGEWIGLDAQTETAPEGVGLASAGVHDRSGPCGRIAQTLLLAER